MAFEFVQRLYHLKLKDVEGGRLSKLLANTVLSTEHVMHACDPDFYSDVQQKNVSTR